MSHFRRSGRGSRLFELDSRVIDAAGSLAPTLFLDTLHELHSTVCGYQPVALLLETLGLLPGEEVFQQTLDYQTSAEITGDFEHVSATDLSATFAPIPSAWMSSPASAAQERAGDPPASVCDWRAPGNSAAGGQPDADGGVRPPS